MTAPDVTLPDPDESDPVELVEAPDADAATPPDGWDADAHDEDDRGDGVTVTDETAEAA